MNDYRQEIFYSDEESNILEYKKSHDRLSLEMFETYSAFANTKGGKIILGIDETKDASGKNQYTLIGVRDPQQQIEEIVRKISDRNFTNEDCIENTEIITNKQNQKKIIIIDVKESKHKPVYVKSKKDGKIQIPYIRKASEDIKLEGEELSNMLRRQNQNIDNQILQNVTIEDLNLQSINDYRRRISENPRFAPHDGDSTEEFLKHVEVLRKDYSGNGEYGITIAGLLFFGKHSAIESYFPNYQLDLYDYRTDDANVRWNTRISTVSESLNLYDFFIQSHMYLQSTTTSKFELAEDLSRNDRTYNQLKIALREALINTIMHADYFEDFYTTIEIYWDFYTFENPGKMKIPKESFFTSTASSYRNPNISKLLVNIGFGERSGTGGEQIFAVAKEDIVKMPEIQTNDISTKLKIWTVDLVKTIPGLSTNARNILQLLFKSMEPLSKPKIAQAINQSEYYTQNALDELIEKNIIEKHGINRGTKYSYKRSLEESIAYIKQRSAELEFPNRY